MALHKHWGIGAHRQEAWCSADHKEAGCRALHMANDTDPARMSDLVVNDGMLNPNTGMLGWHITISQAQS